MTVSEYASRGVGNRLVWELQGADSPLGLRGALGFRLRQLEQAGKGLLITIDEAQAISRVEQRDLLEAVANAQQQALNLVFAVAGIPPLMRRWADVPGSIMFNANRVTLEDVPVGEVETAFGISFSETGFNLTSDQLHEMAEATYGYPYLTQLVGYFVWRQLNRGAEADEAVQNGIDQAIQHLYPTLHEPELNTLSPIDIQYLQAMAQDDGISQTTTIANRMGKSVTYAGLYRTRLIKDRVIKSCGYGKVDFAIPYMRRFLRDEKTIARYDLQDLHQFLKSYSPFGLRG
ncbi:hypothetical protein DF196_11830 [Bifidobacterium callitrichidarum]|uniref:ATP-binding protein n=1 Tax=Bifidobacterium callitrichidarum TaxID=2052941 RepID=A0A2U2N065_9BIFI|nr:hypothetical protein DF196_11830 [Bifidobacterium callitrichidarum]